MKDSYIQLFIISVFLFFSILFILDTFEYKEYFLVRKPLLFREPMVDLMPQTIDRPYSLLEGVLPLKRIKNLVI